MKTIVDVVKNTKQYAQELHDNAQICKTYINAVRNFWSECGKPPIPQFVDVLTSYGLFTVFSNSNLTSVEVIDEHKALMFLMKYGK